MSEPSCWVGNCTELYNGCDIRPPPRPLAYCPAPALLDNQTSCQKMEGAVCR